MKIKSKNIEKVPKSFDVNHQMALRRGKGA